MAVDTFHVAELPTCTHTDATREVLNKQPSVSQFIRSQILKFAVHHGFELQTNSHKPDFIDDDKWQEYVKLNEKSRYIDYTFFLAYHYLKSLTEFKHSSDANLMRLIVLAEL